MFKKITHLHLRGAFFSSIPDGRALRMRTIWNMKNISLWNYCVMARRALRKYGKNERERLYLRMTATIENMHAYSLTGCHS
jgi:hypothetical protein